MRRRNHFGKMWKKIRRGFLMPVGVMFSHYKINLGILAWPVSSLLLKQCFTYHKINLYNQALSQYKKAIPYLYFLAKITPTSNFTEPGKNGHKDIDFLENMLIGQGVGRNPELLNIKGTKLLRELNVPGIINTKKGQASAHAVQELRKIFNT